MNNKPNLLFLMTDQMQGRVLETGHPCTTPNFDRLASMGVRFGKAYTPNAVCSPARASLMTGLLPHNHGVLAVTHTVDDDQSCLRTDKLHWAQRLSAAGYRTGYFGKWHVERSNELQNFGWQVNGVSGSARYQQKQAEITGGQQVQHTFSRSMVLENPPGYRQSIFYGVTDVPPEQRAMGIITSLGLDFLDEVVSGDDPWCCFVSVPEPHDPFIAGQAAFEQYNLDEIELGPNVNDAMQDRPGIYRRSAQTFATMTDEQKREAATCYYASITEIDQQFGRIIDRVEQAGELANTIVVLTSDHGELLGAHGLYTKNFGAFEEVYNIPLIVTGPGIAPNIVSDARVGLHDLCPTLLDLCDSEPISALDARSFATLLHQPENNAAGFTTGFAEYTGNRFQITQRVLWEGSWKYVLNGFDFDELYNLDDDPYELNNLAEDPAQDDRIRTLMAQMWRIIKDTGDHSLTNSHYPPLRLARYGPLFEE